MALLKDSLIAHYKMNESGAFYNPNPELVTNGDFSAWTADNPDGWVVTDSAPNQEVSEVASGEAHANAPNLGGGMCNIYTDDGTSVYMRQDITLIVGRTYRVFINIDTVTAGGLYIFENDNAQFTPQTISSTGVFSWTFVCTNVTCDLRLRRAGSSPTDITFDDVSIKLSDVDELITNGDFADWTGDEPDGWTVDGESGNDPEISEAATGEAHADTPTLGGGFCNLYTSDGTFISIRQTITLIIGRKYYFSINVDTVTSGGITVTDSGTSMMTTTHYSTTGAKTQVFVATGSSMILLIARQVGIGACDVTFDDVSIKLLAVEDSSGNGHHALAQQDTAVLSVPGKIQGAFNHNGSSDYEIIPDHDDFTPALTPLSIVAWVKMVDATNFMIASKGIITVDGEWRFRIGDTELLEFLVYDESINRYKGRRFNTILTGYEGQWIHVGCTYDGGISSSSIKLYLNSIRVDDTNYEGTAGFIAVENLAHDVWIGRYDGNFANGIIDNVMFFNKELTPLEVKLLCNGGAGTENIPIGIGNQLSRTGQRLSTSQL